MQEVVINDKKYWVNNSTNEVYFKLWGKMLKVHNEITINNVLKHKGD